MSAAYHERYGGNWLPLANGSDPSRFPPQRAVARGPDEPFVIRYMGALADDMTYASVCDVAHAVAGLAERHPVQLQIHTMDWCREKRSEEHTSELQSIMRISYAVFCLKKKILRSQAE